MTSSDRLSEIRKRLDASPFVDDGWDEDMRWLIEQYAALRSKLSEVRSQIEAACDEWEASGDDERLVNDVLDPLVKSFAILDGEETDRG